MSTETILTGSHDILDKWFDEQEVRCVIACTKALAEQLFFSCAHRGYA